MESDGKIRHPSFVTVNLHRLDGSPGALFGSALELHSTFYCLKVRRAYVDENGNNPHFVMPEGESLIEVHLSAAQFIELFTTMNTHAGVPGTLRAIGGKPVERPPQRAQGTFRHIVSDFMKKSKERVERMTPSAESLLARLRKKLNKAELEELQALLNEHRRLATDDQPFALSLFQEQAAKVVTAAKAEIDAFVTHEVVKLGLQALKDKFKGSSLALDVSEDLQLPPKE